MKKNLDTAIKYGTAMGWQDMSALFTDTRVAIDGLRRHNRQHNSEYIIVLDKHDTTLHVCRAINTDGGLRIRTVIGIPGVITEHQKEWSRLLYTPLATSFADVTLAPSRDDDIPTLGDPEDVVPEPTRAIEPAQPAPQSANVAAMMRVADTLDADTRRSALRRTYDDIVAQAAVAPMYNPTVRPEDPVDPREYALREFRRRNPDAAVMSVAPRTDFVGEIQRGVFETATNNPANRISTGSGYARSDNLLLPNEPYTGRLD